MTFSWHLQLRIHHIQNKSMIATKTAFTRKGPIDGYTCLVLSIVCNNGCILTLSGSYPGGSPERKMTSNKSQRAQIDSLKLCNPFSKQIVFSLFLVARESWKMHFTLDIQNLHPAKSTSCNFTNTNSKHDQGHEKRLC